MLSDERDVTHGVQTLKRGVTPGEKYMKKGE